ncbi:MAG: rhodanese-like domain-containing protein [Candidatus Firestonebacteria bacterium]
MKRNKLEQNSESGSSLTPTFKSMLIALNIALCSIAVGFLFNSINPLGLEIKTPETVYNKVIIFKDGKRIDPEKGILMYGYADELEYLDLRLARRYYDGGKSVFIDARTKDGFANGHIKGAISLPAGNFEENYNNSKSKIEKDSALIIYCSNPLCSLSERVAVLLKLKKHKNIKVLSSGWGGWDDAKYPTEKTGNETK